MKNFIRVGLVDDHTLFCKGVSELLERFDEFEILFEFNNGKELQLHLSSNAVPDVILLDINMPEMDGYQTTAWMKVNFPNIKILILSMHDADTSIIKVLKAGAHGYLLKDAHPKELREAIKSVVSEGYYHTSIVVQALMDNLQNPGKSKNALPLLNGRETRFLQLVCSELTYKEIADEMSTTPRSVDGYREALFEKFAVKSRVGLAMVAIRTGIFKIEH